MKFQNPSLNFFLNGRTNAHTHREGESNMLPTFSSWGHNKAKAICSPLFQSWGHKNLGHQVIWIECQPQE